MYGTVKQFGGYIWVYSEVGRGTTFKLYFPQTAVAPEHRPSPESRVGGPLGAERILLVEDDAAVRAFCSTVLTRHGYRVIEAAGPGEALAIVAPLTEPVDLILTDIVMPGMSGPQMVGQLVAMHQHRPVL